MFDNMENTLLNKTLAVKPIIKAYTLYDFHDIRCLGEANLWRQKIG